jgi:hypothetical protein
MPLVLVILFLAVLVILLTRRSERHVSRRVDSWAELPEVAPDSRMQVGPHIQVDRMPRRQR